MKTIGVLIKSNRRKFNLGQDEISQSTGITRQRLSQIENGKGLLPTIQEAARLAELYNDPEIVKATCSACQIHDALLTIAQREAPAKKADDLRTMVEVFVTPIADCCTRIREISQFRDSPGIYREKSLLIVEEANRIRFLADALGLLTAQVG